jgi:hypothetical protein
MGIHHFAWPLSGALDHRQGWLPTALRGGLLPTL